MWTKSAWRSVLLESGQMCSSDGSAVLNPHCGSVANAVARIHHLLEIPRRAAPPPAKMSPKLSSGMTNGGGKSLTSESSNVQKRASTD